MQVHWKKYSHKSYTQKNLSYQSGICNEKRNNSGDQPFLLPYHKEENLKLFKFKPLLSFEKLQL